MTTLGAVRIKALLVAGMTSAWVRAPLGQGIGNRPGAEWAWRQAISGFGCWLVLVGLAGCTRNWLVLSSPRLPLAARATANPLPDISGGVAASTTLSMDHQPLSNRAAPRFRDRAIWYGSVMNLTAGTAWRSFELVGIGCVEPNTRVGISTSVLRINMTARGMMVPVKSIGYDRGQPPSYHDFPKELTFVELLPIEVHVLPILYNWPEWAQVAKRWDLLGGCDLYAHFTTWGSFSGGRFAGAQYSTRAALAEYGVAYRSPLVSLRAGWYDVRIRSFAGPQGYFGPEYSFEGLRDSGFTVALELTVGGMFRKTGLPPVGLLR